MLMASGRAIHGKWVCVFPSVQFLGPSGVGAVIFTRVSGARLGRITSANAVTR